MNMLCDFATNCPWIYANKMFFLYLLQIVLNFKCFVLHNVLCPILLTVLCTGAARTESTQSARQNVFQCRACGEECVDRRGLTGHMRCMIRVRPGGPTCLQELGFSSFKEFEDNLKRELRRNKVSKIISHLERLGFKKKSA